MLAARPPEVIPVLRRRVEGTLRVAAEPAARTINLPEVPSQEITMPAYPTTALRSPLVSAEVA